MNLNIHKHKCVYSKNDVVHKHKKNKKQTENKLTKQAFFFLFTPKKYCTLHMKQLQKNNKNKSVKLNNLGIYFFSSLQEGQC